MNIRLTIKNPPWNVLQRIIYAARNRRPHRYLVPPRTHGYLENKSPMKLRHSIRRGVKSIFIAAEEHQLTHIVSPTEDLFVEYGRISVIWQIERPHVAEPNRCSCTCLFILEEPLDRWLPVLLMTREPVYQYQRTDIFPSLRKAVIDVRVWTELSNPVSFHDDPKWEAWTGVKHVVL